MAGQSQFTKAVEIMQSLPRDGKVKPSGETPLKLHALYQQGSQGDMNTARPGMLDAAGKIRWDTWNELRARRGRRPWTATCTPRASVGAGCAGCR
ncbi:acyl-CoA-binding protein [Streptomyces sp. NPDC059593]|uniref:acyl-CoA-binding protein n=1 Tax=Streptomyces sp. NPDC059593 TaxID=3346878 RepID=UPI0036CFEF2C